MIMIRRDALGVGVERRHEAMPQHRVRHFADVLRRDVQPAVQDRPRLAAEDQILARARPRAPGDQLGQELRRPRLLAAASRAPGRRRS